MMEVALLAPRHSCSVVVVCCFSSRYLAVRFFSQRMMRPTTLSTLPRNVNPGEVVHSGMWCSTQDVMKCTQA
jgi:hypothetical protein